MRPLELVIEGLHSYRERQVVDFSRLGERGLFGIFGATGSGKSTILDALTLALYGELARSPTSQGIVHPEAKTVFVGLTFEAGPESKVWRVERTYRRKKKGDGLECRPARLMEQEPGGGWRACAEGALEVSRAVAEDVVGLEDEDFSRAVVLPQGKFAEFLQLQGAKRRAMLERILGLERYGDRLHRAATRRLAGVDSRLTAIGGAHRELEHATAQAVQVARDELAAARCLVGEREAVFKRVGDSLASARAVRQLELEAKEHEARRARLEERKADVAQVSDELDAADRAEAVRGSLDEGERLAKELESAAQAERVAASGAGAKTREREGGEEAWKKASEERRVRGPLVTRRRDELKEAVRMEADSGQVASAVEELARERAGREEERARAMEQAAQAETVHTDAQRRLEALRGERDQVRVEPSLRRRVADASAALEALREAEAAQKERDRKASAKKKAAREAARSAQEKVELARAGSARIDELAAKRAAHELSCPGDEKALRRALAEVVRLAGVIDAIGESDARHREELEQAEVIRAETEKLAAKEGKARKALKAAEKTVGEARTRLEKLRQKEELAVKHGEAARLAQGLEEGERCPVCGATRHPQLAVDGGAGAIESARRERVAAQKALQEKEGGLLEERAGAAAIEGRLEARREAQARSARLAGEKAEQAARRREGLVESRRGDSLPELRTWQKKEAAQREAQAKARDAWQDGRERLAGEEKLLREGRAKADADAGRARAQAEEALKAADEAQAELGEALALVQARREALDARRGELAVEAIASERARLDSCDRRAAELDGLIAQADHQSREASAKGAALRSQKESVSARLEELVRKAGELEDRQRTLKARLRDVTDGRAAAALLAACEQESEDLEGLERAAAERLKKVSDEDAQAQARLAREKARAEALRAQWGEVARRLEGELLRLRFASAPAARAALRGPARREELRGAIQRHGEELRDAEVALRRAREALGGRSVDDAAFAALVLDGDRAQMAQATAQKEAGRLEERLTALEGKHERLEALLADQAQLQPQADRLRTLARLVEGRAFVEFMAEREIDAIARDASARLMTLTRERYELLPQREDGRASTGFMVRDNHNGGMERPASSLSGGETFLASLSLALALSMQIQLRGDQPIRFFFLDEGFGTLDASLLDVALTALERLQREDLTVGVITHVPEVRARLPRRLIVEAARPGVCGSRVRIEEG